MSIGHRIKERRKALKISADELGKRLGKNRATVYRYENGDIENLPIDILEPIAAALGTTPQYLMGWDESPEELGTLAADVMLNPDLARLAQLYMDLEEADKNMVLMLVENLHQKTKKD